MWVLNYSWSCEGVLKTENTLLVFLLRWGFVTIGTETLETFSIEDDTSWMLNPPQIVAAIEITFSRVEEMANFWVNITNVRMFVVKVRSMLTNLFDGCLFKLSLSSNTVHSGYSIMKLKLISFEGNLAKMSMPKLDMLTMLITQEVQSSKLAKPVTLGRIRFIFLFLCPLNRTWNSMSLFSWHTLTTSMRSKNNT